MAENGEDKPRCFMAMPITTHDDEAETYGDADHWLHIRETLFEKAIRDAGYEPVVPVAKGAFLIHERIVTHLEQCELVLCDLSSNNPNVFWELGVRTSLDKPIALVWDGLTKLPFDTGGINTFEYDPQMTPWRLEQQQADLKQHIIDSAESCDGRNPLWRQFGLTLRAQQPSTDETPLEAKLDLLLARLDESRSEPTPRQTSDELINRWFAASQTHWPTSVTSDLIRPNAVHRTAQELSGWVRSLGLHAEMRAVGTVSGEDAVLMRLVDPVVDAEQLELLRSQITRIAGLHGVTVHVEYRSASTPEGAYSKVIIGGKKAKRLYEHAEREATAELRDEIDAEVLRRRREMEEDLHGEE